MPDAIIVEEHTDNPYIVELSKTVDQLARLLMGLSSEKRAKAISTVIASTVVSMPEDQWQRTMHGGKIPCNKPECRCHIVTGGLMDAIDEIRDDCMASYKQTQG